MYSSFLVIQFIEPRVHHCAWYYPFNDCTTYPWWHFGIFPELQTITAGEIACLILTSLLLAVQVEEIWNQRLLDDDISGGKQTVMERLKISKGTVILEPK